MRNNNLLSSRTRFKKKTRTTKEVSDAVVNKNKDKAKISL